MNQDMKLEWTLLTESDKMELAQRMMREGEKQSTIDVAMDQNKTVRSAMINTVDELRSIVNHDFKGKPYPWDVIFPDGQSRQVTIGRFYDLITAHKLPFEGDWLGDCKRLYDNYDHNKVRIFVGIVSDDKIKEYDSKYVITDGAHRTMVILRRLDEGYEFRPIPVFTTDVE